MQKARRALVAASGTAARRKSAPHRAHLQRPGHKFRAAHTTCLLARAHPALAAVCKSPVSHLAVTLAGRKQPSAEKHREKNRRSDPNPLIEGAVTNPRGKVTLGSDRTGWRGLTLTRLPPSSGWTHSAIREFELARRVQRGTHRTQLCMVPMDYPQLSSDPVHFTMQDDMKRQLLCSSSPTIHLSTASTMATTPLLPSFGSISPANTTPTTRFPVVGGSSLLAPLKLEYCRFQGCANFGKMQGYCHDHIHGRPAQFQQQSPAHTPFSQSVNPLPSLALPSPATQPQYLPALRTVVPTRSRPTEDRTSVSVSGYPSYDTSMQPGSPLYTTTAVAYNKRSPIYTQHTTFLSVPLTKKPRVLSSPTPSTGSTSSTKPVAKCRRDGCANDARRKGLCMEHGGRHFCKMAGCQKCAHRGGFCISHGGGRRCAVANCTKSAQSGGICYSHGGGKRCATDGCTHAARSGGFCIKHGKQQQQLQQQRQY